ncbi:hypothetical protein PPL_08814 [Heterostelium album PN500]|uniref:Uncharacterized protein n=1 Tax=Heterostelium pallidum (strain ATCC 26659 / Pp 5 / PN500) TaxID=670386 RepID=D3BJT4_HETP5|nr:hypothetical protein PPL_08814 [Heterostelium album PN500]EFA78164.1 hypothetical protein PPL_08814 [Heterostelium album PN500]|eukprot:XP_020430290.1 hypothetical protein PPL_08814 [Heterostelium album PN500]
MEQQQLFYSILSLLVSVLISSFTVYPIELWRLRRQIYPILKRYHSYLWRLQSATVVDKRRRVVEECFIDEFGWSIFARGFLVELLSNVALVSVVYILLGTDFIFSSIESRQRYEYNVQLSLFNIKLLLAIVIIAISSTYIDFHSQQLKIVYQLNEQQQYNNKNYYHHNNDNNNNTSNIINKKGNDHLKQSNIIYRVNLYEKSIEEVYGTVIPPSLYRSYPALTTPVLQKYLLQALSNVCFYLLYASVYCLLFNYQQRQYTNHAMIYSSGSVSDRKQFLVLSITSATRYTGIYGSSAIHTTIGSPTDTDTSIHICIQSTTANNHRQSIEFRREHTPLIPQQTDQTLPKEYLRRYL